MNKEKSKVIVVLDKKDHKREWPDKIEGIDIVRVDSLDKRTEGDILLYVLHFTDFDNLQKTGNGLGVFVDTNPNWPTNVLWYTGGGIPEDIKLTGHKYKIKVPHNIKKDDNFFKSLSALINEINKKGISEEVWKVLYPSNTHLVALSILCHGYLAAHGETANLNGWKEVWEDLPKNVKDDKCQLTKEKRDMTEERKWWYPALGKEYKSKYLKNELETVGEEKKDYKIIKIIEDKKDEEENVFFENGETTDIHRLKKNRVDEFTNLVNKTCKQLDGIQGRLLL
jgi:hypothetical protein